MIRNTFPALLLFLLAGLFLHVLSSTALAQNDDRGGEQQSPIRTSGINLTGDGGSFYFIDPLGMNLALERRDAGDTVDAATYTLGPGDMLSIVLEGNMSGTFRGLLINPQGFLTIPNVGAASLDGMLISEAEKVIAELVSSTFLETQTTVTLEHPRSIKIHIAGDIKNPGSYLMPSQTRLNKAIIPAVLGPEEVRNADLGAINLPRDYILGGNISFRNIRIERGDETLKGDLVSYTLGGNMSLNPTLRNGDIIHLHNKQSYGPQVSVSGSVVSAYVTEFSDLDTIQSLISMAGGLTFDANEEQIKVYRYSLDGIQTIDVNNTETFDLQPNDRIVVGYNQDKRFNYSARVQGEAMQPGTFPINEGVTTANDLLAMAGGLNSQGRGHTARLTRARPWANINELKRTSDQLLEGFEYLDLENSVGQNTVSLDLDDPEQLASIMVYNNDVLTIPRTRNNIYVFGQVMNPGYYNFDNGLSAYDYIGKAGGYALAAQADRMFIIKAESNAWHKPGETTLQPGDMVFVDREPLESLALVRQEQFHRREIQNRNIQLIFTGLATITSVITAYIAIRR